MSKERKSSSNRGQHDLSNRIKRLRAQVRKTPEHKGNPNTNAQDAPVASNKANAAPPVQEQNIHEQHIPDITPAQDSQADAVQRTEPVRRKVPTYETTTLSHSAQAAAAAPPPRQSVDIDDTRAAQTHTRTASQFPDQNIFHTLQAQQAQKKMSGFSWYEWMIAKRYLRTRRKEGFVSVIAGFSLVGIALGVATLIIVMAVMNGFRIELISRILGVNGHITAYTVSEPYFTNYTTITNRLRNIDGVIRVTPLIEGQLLVSTNRGNTGALVRGVREDDLYSLRAVSQPESAVGTLNNFSTGSGVAVASGLALKLGLSIGDKITLISPKGASTPFGTTPRIKAYVVQYIFKIGMSEYDNALIYMPLEEAQRYFNRINDAGVAGVDMLEIMVDDPEAVDNFKEPIGIAAEQPIRVFTWKDTNASFINALNIERNVMFIILTMIILVAALNIISGLIMLVKDKGRDVAILRTIGVPKQAIMRIFFMCGASIGVIGTTVGVFLGLLFCWNIGHIEKAVTWVTGAEVFSEDIYFLSNLPADVQTADVLLTIFIAIGLSFAATLYPSWRAARLDPVEALRYE